MSAKKAKKTDVRREAMGIFMQVLWFLLLLSLLTYSWKDIGWLSTPANDPLVNSIGPAGAYTAFVVFMFFGVAGYLMPLLVAGWGLLLIFQSMERLWPRVLWMFGILTAFSILVDMNGAFWTSLTQTRLNLHAPGDASLLEALNLTNLPGGFVGYLLGSQLLTRFLGPVGAGLICIGVILSGLFFVSRTHPVVLLRWLAQVREVWRERREERLAAREKYLTEKEREAARSERERAKLEREELRAYRQREKESARAEKLAAREEARQRAQADRAERQQAADEAAAAKRARREAILQRIADEKAAERRTQEEARRLAEEENEKKAQAQKEAAQRARATAHSTAERPEEVVWQLPPLSLLQPIPPEAAVRRPEEVAETIETLKRTLGEFNVEAEVTHVEQGPVVTRYELLPAPGIPVQRFHALAGNITLALKAESIRVQAPVPGKGVVGIEVPNQKAAPVVLREIIESSVWATSRAALPLALGVDVGGRAIVSDLAALPHLLIAGATGQGKTVCMNSLLAGLLLTRTPEELKLILVDPKIVEFSGYNGLPHLQFPVITDSDHVTKTLRWAILEMQRRFQQFAKLKVRDLKGYNQRVQSILEDAAQNPPEEEEEEVLDEVEEAALDEALAEAVEADDAEEEEEDALPEKLPQIVIIIDELADLMLSNSQDIEPQIQKLTQLARATGIHMIIATQRPTVNIITGTIKSNVPGRVAFKVAQKNDSRVVIDQEGADKLVGKGDMLVLAGSNKIVRAQGAWTKDEEIHAIVEFWKQQGAPHFAKIMEADKNGASSKSSGASDAVPGFSGWDEDGSGDDGDEDEGLIQKALDVIRITQRASTSALQRRLRIGYTRAARVMDILEEKGYIGPPRGSEPREILFDIEKNESNGAEE